MVTLVQADATGLITVLREWSRILRAIPVGQPGHASALLSFGAALHARFEQTGVLAELDQAVEVYRQALASDDSAADNLVQVSVLSNLGRALLNRFNRTGASADLDEAVQVSRRALEGAPAGHPVLKIVRSQLGAALHTRFDRSMVPDDLDELVETCRWAIATTHADDPAQAHHALSMAAALHVRFQHFGAERDLDEAMSATTYAVSRSGPGHPIWARALSNLALLLRTRAQRKGKGQPGDVDSAVDVLREAVNTLPADHPELPEFLMNLGTTLLTRYQQTGELADVDEAVDVCRRAVEATPDDAPELAGRLSGLGNVLVDRFQETGVVGHLDEAVDIHLRAVEATPQEHPARTGRLINLSVALKRRFDHTALGTDAERAYRALADAVEVSSAPVSERLKAADEIAHLALRGDAPASAVRLLESAIRLLPELVPRRLRRPDQQYQIARIAGLADKAATVVMADTTTPAPHRAARALALVEAGRAVLLSQLMETRDDLAQLRAAHPELAARFTDLRDRIDRHTSRTVHTDPVAGRNPSTDELYKALSNAAGGSEPTSRADAPEQIRLAEELATTLRHIRTLDGFATFGLPPTTRELLAEAVHGSVVTFTLTGSRCYALILANDRVTSLWLPGLTATSLHERVTAFHNALLGAVGVDRVGLAASRDLEPVHHAQDAQATLTSVLEWLWDTVAGPVLDHLGLHDTPQGDTTTWPRIWWASGGSLGLLPLHAAGYHNDLNTPRRTAIDRVVSSYTPSVQALRHARRANVTSPPTRSLIVGMPTTPELPGNGYLPHIRAEAEILGRLLPGPRTLIAAVNATPDAGVDAPTSHRVLEELPSREIVHFACHGVHAPDPAASRLLLHDHAEAPLTVARLLPISLDGAQLAYLSACNTALTPDNLLVHEAINLASAFQLAGFPHVIGTLWALDDRFAVEIASRFYTALRDPSTGNLDVGRAACALHEVIRSQRDKLPATPSVWATHLHSGA